MSNLSFDQAGNLVKVFFLCSLFILSQFPVDLQSSDKDVFYLPNISDALPENDYFIEIDGNRNETAWSSGNCNWFTFGTPGYFEVEVYGFYKDDSLFLSLLINDNTQNDDDRIFICIDPTGEEPEEENRNRNLSVPESEDDKTPLKLEIKRNGRGEFNIWKKIGEDYVDVGSSPEENDIVIGINNSESLFWEVEVKINLNYFQVQDKSDFGLYVQAIDFFSESNDYFKYCWPTGAYEMLLSFMEVPDQLKWGRTKCLSNEAARKNIRPDIFFHKDHIFDLRTEDGNYVKCGTNNLHSRIDKGFLFTNLIENIPVKFYFASLGADCFEEAGELTTDFSAEENYKFITLSNWNLLCNDVDKFPVSLKVEQSLEGDAITSNNTMIRNNEYLNGYPADTMSFAVTIANCPEDEFAETSNNMSQESRYFSNETDRFYIYVDKTGLERSKFKKDDWEIGFHPTSKDGIVPIPDSGFVNRYYIDLKKRQKAKFFVDIKIPHNFKSSADKKSAKKKNLSNLKLIVFKTEKKFKQKQNVYYQLKKKSTLDVFIRVKQKSGRNGCFTRLLITILLVGAFLYLRKNI